MRRPAPPLASALISARQAALATEQQAVFGYSLLGPRLPASRQPLAHECQVAHAARRDAAAAALRAAGQTPVVAAVDYPGLYPVSDAAAALRLAVRLEEACAAAWRFVYLQAATPRSDARVDPQLPTVRADAQTELTAAAVRGTRWRAVIDPARATVPFPGL